MRVLIVLTSKGSFGTSRTGFRFDEFAVGYMTFVEAGVDVVIASPQGGAPPIDPGSYDHLNPGDAIRAFDARPGARDALRDTLELHRIEPSDFDAVYYPGGSGLLWDLPFYLDSIALLGALHAANRPMAFVSEGSMALCRVRDTSGRAVVSGRDITLISASENRLHTMPMSRPDALEQELHAAGAKIFRAADGVAHVVSDGLLITGQNPASAEAASKALLAAITPGNTAGG
jgi:putative intracellular protease/amidase